MEITINIPGLDALAAAIDSLASAQGGQPAPSSSAASSAASRSTTATARKAGSSETEAQAKVEDIKPAAETKTVQLTADGVKAMAVKLVQMDGGKAKLNDLLKKYGATKFSEVPGDKLVDFANDLVAAGVPLPA